MNREIIKSLLLNYFFLWFIVFALGLIGVSLLIRTATRRRRLSEIESRDYSVTFWRGPGLILLAAAGLLGLLVLCSYISPWKQVRIGRNQRSGQP